MILTYGPHHRPGQTRWYHWRKGQILWALVGVAVLAAALTYCCTNNRRGSEDRPVVYVQPGTVQTRPVQAQPVGAVRSDVVNYA